MDTSIVSPDTAPYKYPTTSIQYPIVSTMYPSIHASAGYGRRGPSGQYDQEASIHDLISACLMLPLGCLCSCLASIVLLSFLGRGFGGSSMTDHSWERYIRDSDIHSHRYVCVVPSVCSLLRAVLSSDIAVRCGKGTAGIPSPTR